MKIGNTVHLLLMGVNLLVQQEAGESRVWSNCPKMYGPLDQSSWKSRTNSWKRWRTKRTTWRSNAIPKAVIRIRGTIFTAPTFACVICPSKNIRDMAANFWFQKSDSWEVLRWQLKLATTGVAGKISWKAAVRKLHRVPICHWLDIVQVMWTDQFQGGQSWQKILSNRSQSRQTQDG